MARVSDCKARDGAWEAAVGLVAALREQCLRRRACVGRGGGVRGLEVSLHLGAGYMEVVSLWHCV